MSSGTFDKALKKFPLGVSVVTVGRGGVENGLTISWAMPISFEPLQFAISVDRNHYSVEFFDSTKNFVINLLGEGQEKLAGHFSRQSQSDAEKLDTVATRESQTGGAILTDAVAYYDCEVVGRQEHGGHILYVGKVVDAGRLKDETPLTTLSGIHYSHR